MDINDYIYGTGIIGVAESDVDTTYDIPNSPYDDLGTTNTDTHYIDQLSDNDPMKAVLLGIPTDGKMNPILLGVTAFILWRFLS